MAEEWRECVEFPAYEVSDKGRVRNKATGLVLKQRVKKSGYVQYVLYKDNNPKDVFGHIAVAKTFLPNPLNKRTVDHIDNNKTNNCLSNLQWATDSENTFAKTIQVSQTGFRGVSKDSNGVGFRAYISSIYLGYFRTAEEASEMYEAVGRGLFGEFFKN